MKNSLFILILLAIIYPATANADYLFNNRNNLIGDRAALMGGAYTALSEDVSGAFYNPAGIAYVRPLTSNFANNYAYQRFERENLTTGEPIMNDLHRFNNIPTMIGITYKFGELHTALSLFQTDMVRFYSIGHSADQSTSLTLDITEDTWLIGPSFAGKITDDFAIGLSAFAYYTQMKFIGRIDSAALTSSRENDLYSLGFSPVFGAKWKASESLDLGLSYGMETIHISGTNSIIFRPPGSPSVITKTVDGDMRLPHRVTTGVAWHNDGLTLAFDATYYFAMEYPAPNEPIRTAENENIHKERAHFDLSLGTEYILSEKWNVRGGLFTNTSSATGQYGAEKINMYGGSFGVGYVNGSATTNFGIIVQRGDSDASASDFSPALMVSEKAAWTRTIISFLIGGSYEF
ncbi:MAG: outer membrane protein transport protein [Deltaproteobacteria bacterium]|nr:outer membrane protein transport protein [Deltaproteobacteria bacterium]MBZ0219909.1 outer membrane protein transport protein [Deltaproteobacteria bacterium]